MNLSKKHVHKSMSLIELMSPKSESSLNRKEPDLDSLSHQLQNDDYQPQNDDYQRQNDDYQLQNDDYQLQNDDYDDDYLLSLVDYDFSNEIEEAEAFYQVLEEVEKEKSIKYQEFPIEDGYVRVPVKFPGLNFSKMSPPDLKLWTAETAFKEQIVPQLYLFIPSALLGFILGLTLWTMNLVILRLYGSARKGFSKESKTFDLDLKFNAVGEENLWKKISDVEKINAIDGTMKKTGDKLRSMRTEELVLSGLVRGGGSDRKFQRPSHLIESVSASEGKQKGTGRRRIYN